MGGSFARRRVEQFKTSRDLLVHNFSLEHSGGRQEMGIYGGFTYNRFTLRTNSIAYLTGGQIYTINLRDRTLPAEKDAFVSHRNYLPDLPIYDSSSKFISVDGIRDSIFEGDLKSAFLTCAQAVITKLADDWRKIEGYNRGVSPLELETLALLHAFREIHRICSTDAVLVPACIEAHRQ